MSGGSTLPEPVGDALDVWLREHDDRTAGVVEGLYLVGSLALDDWYPGSDIDIVAFTSHEPAAADIEVLESAHTATCAAAPGVDIDGPRLMWSDVATAPRPRRRPWTLQGEFHHDDGCFELNPVVWHTLANRGIAVRGPAPSDLAIHVDPVELHTFVLDNTAGYWRSVAAGIEDALNSDADRTTFRSEMTSWSVLGLARMLYTARTGDVASKSAAGSWFVDEHPEHRQLVEHALAVRRTTDPAPDDRRTVAATASFVHEVADLVAAT